MTSPGTFIILNSDVTDNNGGGIYNHDTLIVQNSDIIGNNGGDILNTGTVTLKNVTLGTCTGCP